MPNDPSDLTRNQLLNLVDDVYPGDFTDFSKNELLSYIRKHPNTRFEKMLTSANVVHLIERNRREAQKAKKRAKKKTDQIRRIAGKPVKDPQYDIEVEFSDDGEAFSNPIDVESNTTYQCRMRLRQHQGEFNSIGFELEWKKSSLLSFVDGYGATTYEEAVSNPLVIARLVRTGSVSSTSKMWVKVVVRERFI